MDLDDVKANLTLDAKGLSCPMPLLKTKKAMDRLESGQVLEVLGTDPGSKNDLPGWCERAGHTYLGAREEAGVFRFYIRKR
ncbi:MAG: sulfurtransferase TusA family protein [Thermodesulfobacteriota bacterium]